MIKPLYEKICSHEGCVIFLPSSEEEIKNTNSVLSCFPFALLPEDYQNFLRISNGFICNGIELMGTLPQQRLEKQYIFPDIIQINKPYAQYDYFADKLIIGRLSESMIIYDRKNTLYAVIDRINLRSRLEVDNFRELFLYILGLCNIKV